MIDGLVTPDVKDQMKKIKQLNSSILIGLPNMPDVNSDIISKIGVLYGSSGDERQ